MKSLFGDEIPDISPKTNEPRGKFNSWKIENAYHRSQYPGISCKECNNFFKSGAGNKNFFKCKVMGSSASTASDIRANHVCVQFDRK